MADYGRYGDDQIRDRERSRYGRDTGTDRSGGSTFFGGGGSRDTDWRRERGHHRHEGRFETDRTARDDDPTRGRAGQHFGSDDNHDGLPTDETSRLIGSNKVEGTAVYGRDGSRLGSVYNFMVDKRSGKVEYAVMTYGGFLGMGTRYYPLPWDLLSFDTRLGGYLVEMTERDLERAPSFDRTSEPSFDQSYGNRVRSWYGLGS